MKIEKIGTFVNQDTFEPNIEYKITLPISAIDDSAATLTEEEIIQMLGRELYLGIKNLDH